MRIVSLSYFTAMRKKIGKVQPVEKIWLNTQETCDYLGISQDTLQKFRDDAEFSFAKLGTRLYLHDKNSIDKFVRKKIVV